MIYKLSLAEKKKLQQTIQAALSVPFIAGIEGYVWESIFHFVKGLALPNPHSDKRKKLLFDAVDSKHKRGWSLKAVQKAPRVGMNFALVIQRADVLQKRVELGIADLTLDSPPTQLGHAILAHWNRKIVRDMQTQGITQPRVFAKVTPIGVNRRYIMINPRQHIKASPFRAPRHSATTTKQIYDARQRRFFFAAFTQYSHF